MLPYKFSHPGGQYRDLDVDVGFVFMDQVEEYYILDSP